MPLLQKSGTQNPAEQYIAFSGADGSFNYWDKDKKEKVAVPMPIEFISLAELPSVTGGYKDSAGKYISIYSNIVADINQMMTVKDSMGNEIARGNWADIKEKVKAKGGKFCLNIFAIHDDSVVVFKVAGAALSAWINKSPGDNIAVADTEQHVNGAITYYSPIFISKEISKEETAELVKSELVTSVDEYVNSLELNGTSITEEREIKEEKEEEEAITEEIPTIQQEEEKKDNGLLEAIPF